MPNSVLSPEAALAVVEAAYELDCAAEAWLGSLAAAFAAGVDGGYGGAGHRFDARAAALQLDCSVQRSTSGATPLPFALAGAPSVALRELCRGRAGVLPAAVLEPEEAAALAGLGHALPRDHDVVLLVASDGHGLGWLLAAAAPRGARLSAVQRERWQRVALQVVAAGQLRAGLARALPAAAAGAHPKPASARLRDAAVACLRTAQSAAERAPVEPGAAWTALASGSWSLVDLFETDGRCVLIARGNPAGAADPRALTQRERQVAEQAARGRSGKEIAYELGLRAPTVSQLLHNAVRKLRAAGVAQLGSVVRALGHPSAERERPSWTIDYGGPWRQCGSNTDIAMGQGATGMPPAVQGWIPAAGQVETRRLVVDGIELLVLSFPAVPALLPADLSAAERDVLRWLLRGESNAQVAARRQTAVRTAANQVASIFRKIGVASRAELAARLAR